MTTFPATMTADLLASTVHANRYTTDPETVAVLTAMIRDNLPYLGDVLPFLHMTLVGRLFGGPTFRPATAEDAWAEALNIVETALGTVEVAAA